MKLERYVKMKRTKDTSKLNHVLTSGVCNGLILGSPKLEKASAQNVEGIVVVKAKRQRARVP